MGWETWTHRRRRTAGLLTRGRVPYFDGRYVLPYCGRITPFPSDYVMLGWVPYVLTPLRTTFPGVFVDAGMNIGQTMMLVRGSGWEAEYVGFEPNPVSFLIARQIALINGLQRCHLIPAGLLDRQDVVVMESNFDTDPATSVIKGFRPPERMKERNYAVVVRGDDALESIGCGRVGVVKIDVEGAELEVLRGLQRCLTQWRPLVVCEVLGLRDGNAVGDFRLHRQRDLEQVLRDHGYLICRAEPPRTFRFLAEVSEDRSGSDYFFVPKERARELVFALEANGFVAGQKGQDQGESRVDVSSRLMERRANVGEQ